MAPATAWREARAERLQLHGDRAAVSGLPVGATVITRGAPYVTSGAPVRVIERAGVTSARGTQP